MTCLCNPHAEPNAPREPNCPIHGLARCDREIAEIRNRPDFLTAPSWLLTMGMMDWEKEKNLIARTSRPKGIDSPNSNTENL
jgi:hypothetical protein